MPQLERSPWKAMPVIPSKRSRISPSFIPAIWSARIALRALCSEFGLQVLLVLVGTLELLAKISLRAIELLRWNSKLAPHCFLVHQLFENDRFQRALPNGRFLGLRESIVLLGIGENGVHLTQQVAISEHGTVHASYRLVAHLRCRYLLGRHLSGGRVRDGRRGMGGNLGRPGRERYEKQCADGELVLHNTSLAEFYPRLKSKKKGREFLSPVYTTAISIGIPSGCCWYCWLRSTRQSGTDGRTASWKAHSRWWRC